MKAEEFYIDRLGECTVQSPMQGVTFTSDDELVLYHSRLGELQSYLDRAERLPAFEMAGARQKIFFDPTILNCGIVTCGGLCPGLNDVIRSVVMSLYHHYAVKKVYGFKYGYEGLVPSYYHAPLELTPDSVEDIHQKGGSLLGSSRGPQDITTMVDSLVHLNIGILFVIGGDGTLRGAQALTAEIASRDQHISVIGIPKTIDNDISFVDMSFGYETAVSESRHSTYVAHVEAIGARNGIGLVKLMGRESGFIAAQAALANSEVNFCLIPEVDFTLEGLFKAMNHRLRLRGHAVIVVGEGAGQNLLDQDNVLDESGNKRLGDIGVFLKQHIQDYFNQIGMPITLKYIDPSYMIRSMPASAYDSAFCLQLGHYAVHAGMAGRTNMLVGHWNDRFTHVPIPLAVRARKKVDPSGALWRSVLEATGQPAKLC